MRVIPGFAVRPCLLKHVIFVGPFEATAVYLTVRPPITDHFTCLLN